MSNGGNIPILARCRSCDKWTKAHVSVLVVRNQPPKLIKVRCGGCQEVYDAEFVLSDDGMLVARAL